ncbi:MAG: NUDIX domain-containing protein [Elusimicrobia bacterium]|nr:NUDIX domain-containing protein [Elusimicrobiota bacterium]
MSRRYCYVATGYLVRDGKTLLLKHKKLRMWLPPGGHIDEGETPDEAVLREALEETGLEAEFVVPPREPVMRLGRVESQHEPQRVQIEEIPGHNHHIDFIYYLRAKPGAHVHRPDESDDIRWHSPEELGLPHVPEEVRDSGREAIALVEASTRNP